MWKMFTGFIDIYQHDRALELNWLVEILVEDYLNSCIFTQLVMILTQFITPLFEKP